MGRAISFQHLSPFKGAEHAGISAATLQGWHPVLPANVLAQ